ncbi:MotA/TolQ/ExbB proton channel family protein [Luteolibacter arcticus]|uniref:MotA/TolQ/ExbB proton channel family protein n=1 Tax=Luteolibacter arcticus TaxID=1581411 RepID=A0ABT3GCR2_9BACT|nr:MotA/TolQ/ExbB proton channel family protein [Luteolibacter arcticus]MCW1921401.1 MotA/TolQ/ExbB proton channel family protein [Luteolibacter arcticus]
MTEPYMPPSTVEGPLPDLFKKKNFWKRAIWWASASVILPPLGGMLVTVIGMMRAFGELAVQGGDTGELTQHVGTVLQATALGLAISFFGLIFLVVAIVRFCSYRKQCLAISRAAA